MIITRHNSHSSTVNADEFPRLKAGSTVTVETTEHGRITGVVRIGNLPGWIVLDGRLPLSVEDVRELIVTEGSEVD